MKTFAFESNIPLNPDWFESTKNYRGLKSLCKLIQTLDKQSTKFYRSGYNFYGFFITG